MAGKASSTGGSKAARLRGPSQTFQVVKSAQLKALVSTVRGNIYSHTTAFGPLSVREIADLIGAAPSSLYYHIEKLLAVGLLVEMGSRQTAGKPEQLYDTPVRRMRMLRALQDPKNDKVLKAIVGSICKQANRDFAKGLLSSDRRVSGARRNIRFAKLICRPNPESLAKINACFDELGELITEAIDGAGERVTFSWIVAPQHRKTRTR